MTIAIDPGKSGGIAYEDTDGSIHAVPMPDTVADLDRLLRALVCLETVCFIEDLPMYRGKMNLRSTAVLFRNFGRIEGVLAALKCRVEYLARPATIPRARVAETGPKGNSYHSLRTSATGRSTAKRR